MRKDRGDFIKGYLDAGDVVMVADATLSDSE